MLKLSGNRWENLLKYEYTTLYNAAITDLAGKFETQLGYVKIHNMSLGSLLIDFSVFPYIDGAQIRETSFLNSYLSDDTSWLSNTQTVYQRISGGVSFTVISSKYKTDNTTQPPLSSVCSDGCAGAVGGAAAIVVVLTIFVAWAWVKHTKQRDVEVRDQLGVVVPKIEKRPSAAKSLVERVKVVRGVSVAELQKDNANGVAPRPLSPKASGRLPSPTGKLSRSNSQVMMMVVPQQQQPIVGGRAALSAPIRPSAPNSGTATPLPQIASRTGSMMFSNSRSSLPPAPAPQLQARITSDGIVRAVPSPSVMMMQQQPSVGRY
jgi:hypothetical protein